MFPSFVLSEHFAFMETSENDKRIRGPPILRCLLLSTYQLLLQIEGSWVAGATTFKMMSSVTDWECSCGVQLKQILLYY